MKGIIDQIEHDFGANSFFGYHDGSKGEDGIYIIDKGICSIKLSDGSKSTTILEKYDFFGPVGYLKELIKKAFLLKHSSLSVVAESDEVKCLFIPLSSFCRVPLWERPIIRKAYEEIAQHYAKNFE